jgi:hypothetical protein
MLVAVWAVLPALAFMFIAGRKSERSRRIHFVNNTDYGLDVIVQHDKRVVVIREIVEPEK